MHKEKKILAIIPARGSSKRLPRKNILPLAGKPLIVWTIEQALSSGTVDRTIVSTDDDEIAEIAAQWKAEVVRRPAKLATNAATTYDVIIHTLDVLKANGYEPDIVILLQPTSPLRESADIDRAVACWQKRRDATVIGVCELDNPVAAWGLILDKDCLIPILGWDMLLKRSQELPAIYIANGAVYVFASTVLRDRERLLGPPLIPYIMPVERSIDIDTQEDFQKAEAVMEKSLNL